MEKCVESWLQKQQFLIYQILIYWLFPYRQKKSFRLNGQRKIFQSSIFLLSRKRCQHQSHWIRNFFSLGILVLFSFLKSLNLAVCQRYGIFSVLVGIIREISDQQLVLRIVKTLPFIHQPDREAPKASDVSAADWFYQHTWKNIVFLRLRLFLGPEIPV